MEGTEQSADRETGQSTEPGVQPDEVPGAEPNWWHRDHPTFSSLAGFFTGLLFVLVVPGLYAGITAAVFGFDTAEELFPFVLVALAVPLILLVLPQTRRFGRYMCVGIVSTVVVVLGVAGLVLWLLVARDA